MTCNVKNGRIEIKILPHRITEFCSNEWKCLLFYTYVCVLKINLELQQFFYNKYSQLFASYKRHLCIPYL